MKRYVSTLLISIVAAALVTTISSQRGGGLEVYGEATLTGGRLQGNAAPYGGGLFANAALSISSTHFISNTAPVPSPARAARSILMGR